MTNDKNILSIDLSKVDRELADLDKQIAALQDRQKWLIQLKNYVPTLVVSFPDNYPNTSPALVVSGPAKAAFISHSKKENLFNETLEALRGVAESLSVSQFVLNRLGEGEFRATEIAQKYADYLGKEFLEVRGNVFNAVSRLKEADKIEEVPEEGRVRGKKLRIKKATTQVAAF